jgi:adenylate cyclase
MGECVSNESLSSAVLTEDIVDWLMDETLQEAEPSAVYGNLCERLRGAGLPLMRGYVTFRVLHPLYSASALVWNAVGGVVVDHMRREETGRTQFTAGPLGHVVTHRLPALRRRLTGPAAMLDFSVLEEFRDSGGTDYLVVAIAFDQSWNHGIVCSWLGDRPSGFTDSEIALLRRVSRELAIALKAKLERSIAKNIAHAYLGKRAGDAVLSGLIGRGDGEKITAVLWYSDLRRSTELADRLSAEAFLQLLGHYFEMTAAAVVDHGGEIVSFIGDAVLGLFRVEGSLEETCQRAFAAATESRRRLSEAMQTSTCPEIDFGVALHVGEVIYGNVGLEQRLQFTIVGSAVNEVVRVEDLTKQLGYPFIVTSSFAKAVKHEWRSLGAHVLRGLEAPLELLTPANS